MSEALKAAFDKLIDRKALSSEDWAMLEAHSKAVGIPMRMIGRATISMKFKKIGYDMRRAKILTKRSALLEKREIKLAEASARVKVKKIIREIDAEPILKNHLAVPKFIHDTETMPNTVVTSIETPASIVPGVKKQIDRKKAFAMVAAGWAILRALRS